MLIFPTADTAASSTAEGDNNNNDHNNNDLKTLDKRGLHYT